jgi:translation initiation factor 1
MDIQKELDDFYQNDFGEKIHIRIQQRNGKKSISSVSGLPSDLDLKKILKTFKKSFKCNGCIIENENTKVIQLQGDQRLNIKNFLVENDISDIRNIIIHGF